MQEHWFLPVSEGCIAELLEKVDGRWLMAWVISTGMAAISSSRFNSTDSRVQSSRVVICRVLVSSESRKPFFVYGVQRLRVHARGMHGVCTE